MCTLFLLSVEHQDLVQVCTGYLPGARGYVIYSIHLVLPRGRIPPRDRSITCTPLSCWGFLMQILVISRVKFHSVWITDKSFRKACGIRTYVMKSNGKQVLLSLKICITRFASLQKAEQRGENLRRIAFKDFSWNYLVVISETRKQMTCVSREKENTKFSSKARRIRLLRTIDSSRGMILSKVSLHH